MLYCKVIYWREVFNHVENISAKEASQKKRARLQKENVYQQRSQGSCKKKSKGQKAAVILKPKTTHSSGLSFTLWENLKVNEILSSAPFDRERRREKRAQGAVFWSGTASVPNNCFRWFDENYFYYRQPGFSEGIQTRKKLCLPRAGHLRCQK